MFNLNKNLFFNYKLFIKTAVNILSFYILLTLLNTHFLKLNL